jgi:hypothetical protein
VLNDLGLARDTEVKRLLPSAELALRFLEDKGVPPPCQIDDCGRFCLKLLVGVRLERIGKRRFANLLVRPPRLALEPVGIGRRRHRLDEKASVETAQFRIVECSP